MALADYYHRGAIAAAQVIAGFDEAVFRSRLESTPVAVAFDAAAARSAEGRALLGLLVRLLSRLYPALSLAGGRGTGAVRDELAELARRINPAIDISERTAGVVGAVAVGPTRRRLANVIYAGARGWDAFIDGSLPQPLGVTPNPFGPGVAAALAAGALFRTAILEGSPDWGVELSAFDGSRGGGSEMPPPRGVLVEPAVLVGAGAIGNAVLWALARTDIEGVLHLVDDETIELGNLQRYVLAERSDERAEKVLVGARELGGALSPSPSPISWRAFISRSPETPSRAILALDSARDRRLVQAALPRWIGNAWTQPGDLGVSVHPDFGAEGACVACLYLPDGPALNRDQLVAGALRIPERVHEVRTLLHAGRPASPELLELIAQRLGQPIALLLPFAARPIDDLYIEGICGGAVIPLGQGGETPRDLHVPLAHQSALAGVLLAAAFARSVLGLDPPSTVVTRINVLRPLGQDLAQPALRRHDGRCLCDDRDFVRRYRQKWRH